MTIAQCARDAAAALVRAGRASNDSRLDVSVLARHVLGWDTATWLMRQQDEAPAQLQAMLPVLIARRAAGEPVAYLTGEKEFYGRSFVVTPAVLIPRPETELLIDIARGRVARLGTSRSVRIVDVGTGSGCIAVTLAVEHPDVQITATDVSDDALAVATRNAQRHGVASRIDFYALPWTADAHDVDIVVTNPPYVPERDRASLKPDVREYEPELALFGGPDGLDVIRALIPAALHALRPDGVLLMEIGAGQFDEVARLVTDAGFTRITPHRDLAGIIRVVEATRG